jgi:YVTN family beta-propeller protein
MDEDSLRRLLDHVAEAAPVPRNIVENSLRAGVRLRRRRRTTGAAACLAVAAVLGATIPAINGAARHQPAPASHGNHATPTLYVAASQDGSGVVTPIDIATGTAGTPIKIGPDAGCLAATPDGKTVYACSGESGWVTPIDTATNKAGRAIRVTQGPLQIVITPDGRTAYVLSQDNVPGTGRIAGPGFLTPVHTATNTPGPRINVGLDPGQVVMSPDGSTVYVISVMSETITPISTATNKAGPAIHIAITGGGTMGLTPNGKTLYVTGITGTVTSYSTATGKAGRTISLGESMGPEAIVFSPDGRTAYVADGASSYVTPIDTATNTAGPPIKVGKWPEGDDGVVITPDGRTVYAVNEASGTVTPINTATNRAGPSIRVGAEPWQLAFAGNQAWVLCLGPSAEPSTGSLTPISTVTNTAGPAIRLAGSPASGPEGSIVIAG